MPLAPRRAAAGFTIVELMVGLVVGMIASAAIIQTFSTFEAQKRSTVAGSEAQENGLVALALLQQDMHNAGAGLVDPITLDCDVDQTYSWSNAAAGPIPNFTLMPLVVSSSGPSTQPDTIQVNTGDFLGALPAYTTAPMSNPAAPISVSRTDYFAVGDIVVVTTGGQCSVMQVSDVQSGAVQLAHDMSSGLYNPAPIVSATWPAYPTGAHVLDPKTVTSTFYQIVNGSLQLTVSTTGATPTVQSYPLVRNLVFMKAQYGVAPVGSQSVDTWVSATGPWAPDQVAHSAALRKRIKAVRIAVVSRSDRRDAAIVTTACTNVSGTVNNGPCAWRDSAANPAPVIDLSADPDWQHYRYKVYQTIVPLRNVLWDNV